MPRDHSRVNIGIWSDPDFRDLPPAAQHLYLLLWTSPSLSYCGVHDWRPGRLAALSRGFTAEHIRTVGDCLAARHFLVIDEDTEEVLIRSWVRFDGLMKQPRMAISCVTAYAEVSSPTIRKVLAYELEKVRRESPGLTCWGDSRVAQVLTHPAVSAKDLPLPADPFWDGFASGLGLGLPQTRDGVSPRVYTPPTPTPTPTPTPCSPDFADERSDEGLAEGEKKDAGKRPAKRLPPDWKPTEAHWAKAKDGIDVAHEAETFRAHAEANDRRAVVWNAAFTQWLLKAKPRPNNVRNLPTRDDQGRTVLPPLPSKDFFDQ